MPTSRTLNRATILPQSATPRRVMHWRQVPAQPPVPLANRPVELAVDQAEEPEAVPSAVRAPRVLRGHRMIRLFFATLLFLLCAVTSMVYLIDTKGISLLLVAVAASIMKATDAHQDYCSECRGHADRRAKVCPHCHAKF